MVPKLWVVTPFGVANIYCGSRNFVLALILLKNIKNVALPSARISYSNGLLKFLKTEWIISLEVPHTFAQIKMYSNPPPSNKHRNQFACLRMIGCHWFDQMSVGWNVRSVKCLSVIYVSSANVLREISRPNVRMSSARQRYEYIWIIN